MVTQMVWMTATTYHTNMVHWRIPGRNSSPRNIEAREWIDLAHIVNDRQGHSLSGFVSFLWLGTASLFGTLNDRSRDNTAPTQLRIRVPRRRSTD